MFDCSLGWGPPGVAAGLGAAAATTAGAGDGTGSGAGDGTVGIISGAAGAAV